MKNIETVEIPLSKKKLRFYVLGSLAFVVLGVWFLIKPPKVSNPVFGNPTFILIVSIAAILLFGLLFIFAQKKMNENTPGLIIDETGITDNSGAIAAGHIPWTDIEEIQLHQMMNQKFLMIFVRNPEEYINRQTSMLKRKAMQLNHKSYGTPISISPNSLNYDIHELEDLLQRNLRIAHTD